MVLLQGDQLLLQGLDVALQVQANDVGVVQNLPQSGDVGLHRLPHGQLGLPPNHQTVNQMCSSWTEAPFAYKADSLDSEVFRSQVRVVQGDHQLLLAFGHFKYLKGMWWKHTLVFSMNDLRRYKTQKNTRGFVIKP